VSIAEIEIEIGVVMAGKVVAGTNFALLAVARIETMVEAN
jgi:hypothetical protein